MQSIDSLLGIADDFDVIVFDQWGVLHNGSTPYSGAPGAVAALHGAGKRLGVLSNSGKRAQPNAERIGAMGLPVHCFESVMTSGEAFWQDLSSGQIAQRTLLPITAKEGDAQAFATGLDVAWTDTCQNADAILLMGIPEGSDGTAQQAIMNQAMARQLPVYCTNPDRASPRANGLQQVGPGSLAHAYKDAGGTVVFYGKPHRPVFDALTAHFGVPTDRMLMVGDSLEHDIAGAQAAGWQSLFVSGGLYADVFAGRDATTTCKALVAAQTAKGQGAAGPDFIIHEVKE